MSVVYPAGAFEVVEDDFDLNDLLVPGSRAVTSIAEALLYPEDLDLEEAVRKGHDFDESRHPRWPKGTPKGGQFIRAGQHFTLGGHQYQVAHVFAHKIVAHETGGEAVKTVELNVSKEKGFQDAHPEHVTVVPKISAPTKRTVKGDKGANSEVTTIDPYVDSATHDPSIPIPDGATFGPEEWKTFGKLDQENYVEVQERFGAWHPTAAQTLVVQSYANYEKELSKLQAPVDAKEVLGVAALGYQAQYSESTGKSLSLVNIVKYFRKKTELHKKGHSYGESAAHYVASEHLDEHEFETREHAMVLQGEHRAAVQWDLYNRVKAPDVASVHKAKESPTTEWQPRIEGKERIFSGLSQSWNYRRHFFGTTSVCTPIAIRHVLMSTLSAQADVKDGHVNPHHQSEAEISVAEQMLLDPKKSFVFTFERSAHNGMELSQGGAAWFEGVTNDEPQPGSLLDTLRDHFTKGEDLPIPAEGPMIHMKGSSYGAAKQKLWIDPKPEGWTGIKDRKFALIGEGKNVNAEEFFFKDGKSYSITSKDADGTIHGTEHQGHSTATLAPDETVPIAQPAAASGVSAGDYIMGLRGQRYIVVADPGDDTGFGLRYIPVDSSGTAQGGEGWNFEGGGLRPFYKLEGHYEAVKPKVEGATPGVAEFDATQWTLGVEPKKIKDWEPGAKFKVNGVNYEITGFEGSQATIKDLSDGNTGTINIGYKTVQLIPKAGSEAEAAAAPKVLPQKGDFLAHNGAKWTVTTIQKNGLVRLTSPGQPFMARHPDDPIFHGLHSPDAHDIGPKQKLRDFAVGEKFHMGSGSKQKPYLVEAHGGPGKPSIVRDLSTGKLHSVSRNTSYSKLVPSTPGAPADDAPAPPGTPKATPSAPNAPHDPTAYILGTPQNVGSMEVGAKLRSPGGADMYVVSHDDNVTLVAFLDPAKSVDPVPVAGSMMGSPLLPKADNNVPYANLTKGDVTAIGELKPGDQFTYSGSKYELVGTGDDGNPLVAEVGPGNTLGMPHQIGVPNTTVEFHAHAIEAATAPHANAIPEKTDPTTLPQAPFTGYGTAYAKGGKEAGGFSGKKHKISEMAPGTVFRVPGNGPLWKVKVGGPSPIVTDGEKNYQVDGKLRGRASIDLHELPQGDYSPDVYAPGHNDDHMAEQMVLKPNASTPLSSLSKGDLFELPQVALLPGTYKVEGQNSLGDVLATHTETGHGHAFSPEVVAEKVALSTPIENEPAAKASPATPTPSMYVPPPPGVDAHEASTLSTNDHFYDGNGNKMTVALAGDWGVVAKDEHGNTYGIDANQLVVPIKPQDDKPDPSKLGVLHEPNVPGTLVKTVEALQPGDVLDDGHSSLTVLHAHTDGVIVRYAGDENEYSIPAFSVKSMKLTSKGGSILAKETPEHPAKTKNKADFPVGTTGSTPFGDQVTVVDHTPFGNLKLDNSEVISPGELQNVKKPAEAPVAAPPPPKVWSEYTHTEGPWKNIADFAVGDMFQGSKGGFHQVVGKDEFGNAQVVSLKTGKLYDLTATTKRRLQVPKDEAPTTEPAPPVPTPASPLDGGKPPMDAWNYPVEPEHSPTVTVAQMQSAISHPIGKEYQTSYGKLAVVGHTPGGNIEVKNLDHSGAVSTLTPGELDDEILAPLKGAETAALAVTRTKKGDTYLFHDENGKQIRTSKTPYTHVNVYDVGNGNEAHTFHKSASSSAKAVTLNQYGGPRKRIIEIGDAHAGESDKAANVAKLWPVGSAVHDSSTGINVEVIGHTNGGFVEVEDGDHQYTAHPNDLEMIAPPVKVTNVTPTPEPSQAAHALAGDVLQPYTTSTGPGHAYEHPKLTTLPFGQQFRDKSGATFIVLGHSGGKTIYRATEGGPHFSADGNLRVKTYGLSQVSSTSAGEDFKAAGLKFSPSAAVDPQDASVKALQAKHGSLEAIPPIANVFPDFTPYKSQWGQGGKFKNPQIGQLAHGAKFQDKNGDVFTFITPYADGTAIIMSDTSNQAVRVSAALLVKTKGVGA